MAALVGPSRAKLILMGGQKIMVDEALSFGLVDRIIEPDALLDAAREIAMDTLAAKPEIAKGIKGMCA
jgi:enoyl-CoA hydratase/carnithine racemase